MLSSSPLLTHGPLHRLPAARGQNELTARLHPLDGHRDGVASAEAKSGDAPLRTSPFHLVEQCSQNAPTRISDGMAHRNSTAIDVDVIRIDTELLHHTQRLH